MRVVIEKPFGTRPRARRSSSTARCSACCDESQVFRIDHYLGKETVQNMLALRFANGMFEPIWNRNYIDYVQITAAEDIGVGRRAGYYDKSGALRDMVQNHMLQLLTLLCMEPPVTFAADEVRDEKVKVLHAIEPPAAKDAGASARSTRRAWRGQEVVGYLEEQGVPADSHHRDLRGPAPGGGQLALGGRAVLPAHRQAARPQGDRDRGDAEAGAAHGLPGRRARSACSRTSSILTMQPNEGVSLSLGAKIPGSRMRIRPVNMEFLYGTAFLSQSPEAYERLILDAMRGDADALHPRRRGRGAVADHRPDPAGLGARTPGRCQYAAGSHGPEEANEDPRARAPLAGDLEHRRRARGPDDGGVWAAQDTTPGAIDDALRSCSSSGTRRTGVAPARVLNLVVIVDREWRGEIINRLEQVGRYHPSRTILCAVEPGRTTIDAWARCASRAIPPASRAHHERGDGGRRRAAPRDARHDRGPARGERPGRRWSGRRTATPRRWTRCCAWRRWC